MSPPSHSKIPPPSVPVISSLADPLTSPYCILALLPTIAGLLAKLTNALKHRDPVVLDLAVSWIKFFAHSLDDPIQYHDVETRLVPTTSASGCRCHCLSLLSDTGLLELHRHPDPFTPLLRTREDCNMSSLVGVVDFLSDYCERVIVKIMRVKQFRYELSERIDQQTADGLGKGMVTWLRKNENVHVYALFGTLLELAGGTMVNTIQSSAPLRRAFWDRSYTLIDSLYERRHQLPDSDSLSSESCQQIDLIFYGMGCFAYAMVSRASSLSPLYHEDTRRKYDTICRLLILLNKANIQIQTGDRTDDKYRLASFAERLHFQLSGNDKLPLSPIIKSVISTMPEPPNGFQLFFSYFNIIDKCHNRLHHGQEPETDEPIPFSVTFSINRRAVKSEQRLQSCAGCNVACYCSKECQTQDWKYGSPSHKELCSSLAKIFKVHKFAVRRLGSLHDMHQLYRQNGISDSEIEMLSEHVTEMLWYFSELDGVSDDLP